VLAIQLRLAKGKGQEETVTKFQEVSTWIMTIIQTVAVVATPIIVWKFLDPGLEELGYKKEPVLAATISTGLNGHRDYNFYISNIGKFPVENIRLLLFRQSSKLTLPLKICDSQPPLKNCVSTDPSVAANVIPAQSGSLPRVDLSNPIQGEHFVQITLHEVTGAEKLQQKEPGLTASVSSDNGPATTKCLLFFGPHDVAMEGGDDLSGSPPC
jgi:hypothetical protein